MSQHKIGDRAACDCGRILIYTSEGWKHGGLGETKCVPYPVAMPIKDSSIEPSDISNSIRNMTTYTRLTVSELAANNVHPNVCEKVERDIHQVWSNALRTANR